MQANLNGSLYSPVSSDRSSSVNSINQEYDSYVHDPNSYMNINRTNNDMHYNRNVATTNGGSWKQSYGPGVGRVPHPQWYHSPYNAFPQFHMPNPPFVHPQQNFIDRPHQAGPPMMGELPAVMNIKTEPSEDGFNPFFVCVNQGGYAYVAPPFPIPNNPQRNHPMMNQPRSYAEIDYPKPFNQPQQDSNKHHSEKRKRMAYKPYQVACLLAEFTISKFITTSRMKELAATLNLTPKQIKVWFQNRRMKEKRKTNNNTESSVAVVVQETSHAIEETPISEPKEHSEIELKPELDPSNFVEEIMSSDIFTHDFFL